MATTTWTPLVLLCLSVVLNSCLGYQHYQQQIPNGNNVPHPCKVNYMWRGVGHENPLGGGPRNPFGLAFANANHKWTVELCRLDTDGDGMTNGEELGDPSCTWSPGQIPSRTVNISHPGVCQPMNSEKCKGRNDFVDCQVQTFADCQRVKQPGVENITVTFPSTPIPPTETNYYCMTFDLPSDQDYHLIASEPVLVNQDVMHHMLLFGCQDDVEVDIKIPAPCGMAFDSKCSNIIAGWTVGSPGECLQEGIGYRFGTTSFKKVLLQMHWNNPGLRRDYKDASGLRLYYQPALPSIQNLSMIMVGQRLLEIPPGKARVNQTGVCSASCSSTIITKTAYVVSGLNHMHYLGRSGRVELFRNGNKVADLAYDEMYSYDTPVDHRHEPPIVVEPGDEIRTSCEYNSLSSSRTVNFGEGTQDEMCFGFLTLYPADAISPSALGMCVQVGPLSPCDIATGKPYGGCDWGSFVSLNSSAMQETVQKVTQNCSLDGICRPGCKKIHDELMKHPCMSGEIYGFVTMVLENSKEGLAFLGRVHSCSNQDQTCSRETCGC